MLLPMVAPRVEETHERPGLTIERAHVAPLPCIASKAGVGEVVERAVGDEAVAREPLHLGLESAVRARGLSLLPRLPGGDSELYSHPSLDEFKPEFDALVSPRVKTAIHEQGIELIRYQDL